MTPAYLSFVSGESDSERGGDQFWFRKIGIGFFLSFMRFLFLLSLSRLTYSKISGKEDFSSDKSCHVTDILFLSLSSLKL